MTWRTFVFASFLAMLMGCNDNKVKVPDVPFVVDLNPELSRQVTEAIGGLNEFSRVLDRTPENLRIAADKAIGKLSFEGRDILAHDLRNFTDHTLGDGGSVAKGAIAYLDAKMMAFVEALKKALEEALPKVKAEKSRDKAVELLHNIKIHVKLLDPTSDLINPNKIVLNRLKTYDGQPKGIQFKSNSPRMVEVFGFGFLRPSDEMTDYRVEVVGTNRTWALSPAVVSQSGPFLLLVNLSDFKPDDDVQKLLISWGKKKLADIPFEKLDLPDDRPIPVAHVIKIRLHVFTTKDDKDKAIRFKYHVHHPEANGLPKFNAAEVTKGENDKWDNRTDRWFEIPIDRDKIFPEKDLLKYEIWTSYDSNNAGHWIGQLEAFAVLDDGREIPCMKRTEDYRMGPGEPSRDFPFNK